MLAVDGRGCRDADVDSAMDLLSTRRPLLCDDRPRARPRRLRRPGGLVFASPGDELKADSEGGADEVEYDCLGEGGGEGGLQARSRRPAGPCAPTQEAAADVGKAPTLMPPVDPNDVLCLAA